MNHRNAHPTEGSLVAAEQFQAHRERLLAIAYRMLGSQADAEDVVQETYLRYVRAVEQSPIESPAAYLATITTRLALDHLKQARVARRAYDGPWLPEPVVAPQPPDGWERAALEESLSMAFLMLLETLDPVERAVLLLREAFDYSYAEIAAIVEASEAHCRQILHRARERVAAGRRRARPSPDEQRQLVEQFLLTCQSGDVQALEALLAADVTAYSDGGGRVAAARRPIEGANPVARFLIGLTRKLSPEVAVRVAWVNDGWGIVTYEGGRPRDVVQLDVAEGRIQNLYTQRNPDKLSRVPALDA